MSVLSFILTLAVGVAAGDESTSYPPLPRGVSSFGAVACDGWLYVYGGHAGKTHNYDTTLVLGTFHRLKLCHGLEWETLPEGPILQGMNLARHRGRVIRVGGMQPRNAPGTPADNHSVVEVAAFDPKVGVWSALPPLPAARSSHDVVVVGDTLVVVGGWHMRGRGVSPVWHDTAVIFDLADPRATWKHIPQPFERRALTATVVGTKVYVLGGMNADNDVEPRTDVLDLATHTWTRGPDLPGAARSAFSPAACTMDDRVVVSLGDGSLWQLSRDEKTWESVGKQKQPRMVHRLIAIDGRRVLAVGGASRGVQQASLELLTLPAQESRAAFQP